MKNTRKSLEESTLERLGKLNDAAQKVQANIDNLVKQSEDIWKMDEYTKQIESIQLEMLEIVETNKSELTGWKPDRISKGKKDIIVFGTNAILRSKTTRRKIIPSEFVKRYPLEANVMIEDGKINIPIGVVEAELGKKKVDEICTSETTFSYKYVSRKIPTIQEDIEPVIEKPKKKVKKVTTKKKVTA